VASAGAVLLLLAACSHAPDRPDASATDAGATDTSALDAPTPDAPATDAPATDATPPNDAAPVLVPQIQEPWWDVAGQPDLGAYSDPAQQPVDFGVWQSADGGWHLWSCIRGTQVGGESRLFYAWRGTAPTAPDWTPVGIAMQADPAAGETPGGLQAPFVLPFGGGYRMFYGDWTRICEAQSTDGVAFTRMLDGSGSSGLFSEGPTSNTRDPMVLAVGDHYNAYYTAIVNNQGADYVRTSRDLHTWSAPTMVAAGGAAGDGPWSAECPFVVYRADEGMYYLFRTQHYGADAQTTVYRSPDPTNFGVNDDRYRVGTLPVAAPEVVEYQGQSYLFALKPGLDGIHVARLAGVPRTGP
jgi:hypothetical protein